jgi:tetratricopeptide (TPR) repeat protein
MTNYELRILDSAFWPRRINYRAVCAAALLFVMCFSTSSFSAVDVDSEFRDANAYFKEGNAASGDEAVGLYNKAILHYEKVLNEGGIKNSGVYYNLGNAYLLKGDVGRAILNYRRSEMLDDSNHDLQKNLAFARSRRVDQVEVATEKKVLQTLFFWHYDFSVKVRFLLACLFFGACFLVLTSMVWFGRRGAMGAVCVVCGVLAVCFALSVTVETVGAARDKCGVIVSESVVARQGDGANYPKSFKDPLHSGTEFDLIKSQSGWYNIRLVDGSEGWIPAGTGELVTNYE